MSNMRTRFQSSLIRLADRPFATAMATLLLVTSIAQLIGVRLTADALELLVPAWMLDALSVLFGLGGACLLLGMASNRTDIEAAGCVLAGNGLGIRLVALVYALGPEVAVIATGLFYVVFGWACLERFVQILRHERIVRVSQKFVIPDGPGMTQVEDTAIVNTPDERR